MGSETGGNGRGGRGLWGGKSQQQLEVMQSKRFTRFERSLCLDKARVGNSSDASRMK